ncbi:hypothetical protein BHM03_00030935 [Ensete ventricosum]|nr:hypothetical protein BHM03_00030935 [Ensete ventricosum]
MAATPVTTAAPAEEEAARQGEEALERLRSADAPLYLSPSPELAKDARTASRYLFSSLVPFCPKPPLDILLADDGFDAEQIWCQIDLLSRPLLSVLRRELNRLEREPPAPVPGSGLDVGVAGEAAEKERVMEDGEGDEEDGDESEGDEEEEEEEEEEAEEDEDEGDEEEKEDEEGEAKGNQVEDKFLKIKELEEYLEMEEENEYGRPERKGNKHEEEDEDDDDEEDAADAEEEDDLDLGDFDGDGDEETGTAENARYEDFFGGIKKKGLNKNGIVGKRKCSSNGIDFVDGLESTDMDIEENDDKVTAAKRPKNSALEVDLDFEHNVRPAPVITEEVTASLEDIIKKRIIERQIVQFEFMIVLQGHFDDVQRAPILPSKSPKDHKELDENKSKKSLAEIYEVCIFWYIANRFNRLVTL